MLDVKDLAIALGISRKTVYALVAGNQIPFYRIGTGRGTIRFDLQEVKDALSREAGRDAGATKATSRPEAFNLGELILSRIFCIAILAAEQIEGADSTTRFIGLILAAAMPR